MTCKSVRRVGLTTHTHHVRHTHHMQHTHDMRATWHIHTRLQRLAHSYMQAQSFFFTHTHHMQHAHHILLPLYFAVAAIGSAFVPVVNAFFVMAIALLLFSMFGVDLFKHVRSVRVHRPVAFHVRHVHVVYVPVYVCARQDLCVCVCVHVCSMFGVHLLKHYSCVVCVSLLEPRDLHARTHACPHARTHERTHSRTHARVHARTSTAPTNLGAFRNRPSPCSRSLFLQDLSLAL